MLIMGLCRDVERAALLPPLPPMIRHEMVACGVDFNGCGNTSSSNFKQPQTSCSFVISVTLVIFVSSVIVHVRDCSI